jgi:hypothetical protein
MYTEEFEGRFRITDPITAKRAGLTRDNTKIRRYINYVKTYFQEHNWEGGFTATEIANQIITREDPAFDGTYGNIPNYKATVGNVYSALHALATKPDENNNCVIRLMGVRDSSGNLAITKKGRYKIAVKASSTAKKQQVYVWHTHIDALPAYERVCVSSFRYILPCYQNQTPVPDVL